MSSDPPPPPQVLFAGIFAPTPSGIPHEISFSTAVTVTQVQICPSDGSPANAQLLPDFGGSTRPSSPFSLQLHCLDLLAPEGRAYLDVLLEQQEVTAGGVYVPAADLVTSLIAISGEGYEQLSIVLYGYVLPVELLPSGVRSKLGPEAHHASDGIAGGSAAAPP